MITITQGKLRCSSTPRLKVFAFGSVAFKSKILGCLRLRGGSPSEPKVSSATRSDAQRSNTSCSEPPLGGTKAAELSYQNSPTGDRGRSRRHPSGSPQLGALPPLQQAAILIRKLRCSSTPLGGVPKATPLKILLCALSSIG